MNFKNSFHPYAITTIIFWALAFIFTRLGLQYFSAFSLGFLRYLIASIVLVFVVFFMKMQLPAKKDLPWFVLSACTGFFLYMIAFNLGQKTVTAATGSVVMATVPVMTAIMARFVYREKLAAYQWMAILIEFVGVIVLTLLNSRLSVNTGLLWLLSGAFLLSIYNLVQRKLTKKYTAMQTATFSILLGTLFLGIFAPTAMRELSCAPPPQYLYIIILGVGSSAIAFVSWTIAFSKARQTSQVTNYMFVTPFLTSILGFWVINETLDKATLVGGGIILLGVMIFNFGGLLRNFLPGHEE